MQLSPAARTCLGTETPRHLDNVQMQIIGSVRELCAAAAAQCRALGYEPLYLTDRLNCEAREAGRFWLRLPAATPMTEKAGIHRGR